MRPSRRISGRGFLALGAMHALLLAALAAPAEAQPRGAPLRLGTVAQRDTSLHRSLLEMAQKWRQAPEGGVQLTIYPGTQGSEKDLVRRMRVGQLQAAMLSASGVAEIDPGANALQKMPFIYRSLEEVEYVRENIRAELEKRLLEKGFVVLFWGDAGWVRFFSKQPARVPGDFRKIRMFAGAGDTDQIELMKEMGLNPVPLEWTDALTALQTGMIDAVPVIPLFALAGQFYTVTKNMVEVNYVPLPGATVMTRKAWDSLTPAVQQHILAAARETGEKITAKARAENEEAIETMKKKHGLQIQPMTPEIAAEWARAAEEVYPKIRGRLVPADMFDKVRQLLANYRNQRAENKP